MLHPFSPAALQAVKLPPMVPILTFPDSTVLIVDDTPADARLLMTALAPLGCQIRLLQTGALARRSIENQLPTAILLDVRLPDCNGYDLCKQLKGNPRSHPIPVIFTSALSDTFDKIRAFEVGGVDYIVKPFHPAEVLARVRLHLTEHQLRRQLEAQNQELWQQQERWELAIAGTGDGIVDWNRAAGTIFVSDPLKRLLGYGPDTLSSLAAHWADHWYDLLHPDDRDRTADTIRDYFGQRVTDYHLELRLRCADGSYRWMLARGRALWNGDPWPLRMVGSFQDISERKAIEDMKAEFVSLVSHELRTPLTGIQGALKLLASGAFDQQPDRVRELLEIAQADSDRLMRLVEDILRMERLESGAYPLEFRPCPLAGAIAQAVRTVSPLAEAARITLKVAPTAAIAFADGDAVVQILTNLLGNAIKFSPPATAIDLQVRAQSDGWLVLSVRDRGRGIPPQHLTSIFDRFWQVDVSDSRQKGGTGLGLAICQQLVQRHGGHIWAESTPGQGSTFHFTLAAIACPLVGHRPPPRQPSP
jgi:PAS domain S-box-containing protein